MPLDIENYQANAEKCEDRAQQMQPSLRRDFTGGAAVAKDGLPC